MSLLQDILDKMYVEPELLEQLDEEQKQTLFIKMREEQIRRWRIHEEKAEEEERKNPKQRKNGRKIQWLTGRDKEVWVWVLGEDVEEPPVQETDADEGERSNDFEEQERRLLETEADFQRLREFEEQERKSREAEAEIRQLAQKTRMLYQKNLRTSDVLLSALNQNKATSLKDAIKQAKPPRPRDREAIVQWYINNEMPKGTGFDPKTNLPARWFHGIISRAESEELLSDKPSGAFLVRVSEKIWGYTISYMIGAGQTKHFLVEVIPEGYQFLGTNQIVHKSLYDLILYHETAPITTKGKEILQLPVGQNSSTPDFADLIDTSNLNGFKARLNFFRRL
uniref:SH2 domain-containing protein n=1 Tax=Panagrolaimus sp. JU765 TaxID=591449 RepID=A0AC34PV74_9BILA